MNMENKLVKVFENKDFGKVRTVMIDNEPWFVGKDVADALGYGAARNAIAAHVDEEDRLTHRFSASGQGRDMTIINESGLYSLVLSSKLPSAKQFKHWVTHDILPTLRKTGSYDMNGMTLGEQAAYGLIAATKLLNIIKCNIF